MLHFGPLKHLWMLRCESKHRYFKNNQFESVIDLVNPIDVNTLAYDNNIMLLIKEFNNKNDGTSIKYICKNVSFKGVQFKEGMSVCVERNLYGNFVICNIQCVLILITQKFIFLETPPK